MPDTTYFAASFDRTTKIISAVFLVLMLVIILVTGNAFVGAIILTCVILSYGFSPRGYVVAERSIIVKRLFRNVRIPLEGVREARPATKDDLRGCFRTCGSGGLFGYYGLFHTSRLGSCNWYVTARQRLVLIVTESKTALLSPDDAEGFLNAIGAQVPIPIPTQPLQPTEYPRSRAALWLGLGGVGAALAVVAAAMLYSPGPPRYTLGADSLSIHDRFYPVTVRASEVDVSHIRTVDLRQDSEWRITARTNGFSNSHYHSGWYRVASGTKIRMYRADSTRLVLIPLAGEQAPVLLETSDPEAFAAELRRTWRTP